LNRRSCGTWYRDSLSGFLDPEVVKRRHEHDIVIKKKGVNNVIRVPIFSLEDMGKNMAIDEKKMGEDLHTVLSNRQTGKIAMLARSVSAKELIHLLPKFNLKGFVLHEIYPPLMTGFAGKYFAILYT
jgi:hypothetical protein